MRSRLGFASSCSLIALSCVLLSTGAFAVETKPAETAAQTAPKAQTLPTLSLRAGVHPTFDRLVIEMPRGFSYALKRDKEKVIVTLSGAASGNLLPFEKARLTRAKFFALETGEKTTLTFAVAMQASVKDFKNDLAIVIDITGPAAPSVPPKAEKTPEPEPKPILPAEKTTPSPEKTVASPAAPLPEKPAPAPVAAAPTKPAEPAPKVEAPAPEIKTEISTKPEGGKTKTKLTLSSSEPELIATLDPRVETGAAVFMRGGEGYIVFDRKITLSPEELSGKAAPPRVKMEPLFLPNNSGFHFPLADDLELRAAREDTAWKLFVTSTRSTVPVSTSLLAQPDYALGPRLLLPAINPPEAVKMTDPIIGDTLLVVPLRDVIGFGVARKLADISLIPSAQGLVIKPLHDKVSIMPVTDGVEISAAGGLKLSPGTDTGITQQTKKRVRMVASGKTLFDFAGWYGKPNEDFNETRQRLTQTIVDVPSVERGRARLELARFYFARGMGEETTALLTYLEKQVPDVRFHEEFKALKGAALILSGRSEEGLNHLEELNLGKHPELILWEAVAHAELREWEEAEEGFARAEELLLTYPDPFYSSFMILAIEAATATEKNKQAAAWLDKLQERPHAESIDSAIHYLRGVLYSKQGRSDVAENLWRKAAQGNDRLYKIRAELALIDLGIATRSLTPKHATERLEGLRFAWRGDDLEVDILHRLGNFYIDADKVKQGLNVLSQATKLYPQSPITPRLKAEMSRTFRRVFLEKKASDISPLEAFALYQDFRDLIPGGTEGVIVARNLADQLVAVDLLEQATTLLHDVLNASPKNQEAVQTASRLAGIYLLNRQPEETLKVLDSYVLPKEQEAALPAPMQTERLLLRARALSDQKKFDDALALLTDNETKMSKMLRADINMRAQRWDDAAAALKDLIGPAPEAGGQITTEQAQWLVNLAIALSLSGNATELDALAINFSASMSTMPQNDTFRVLTRLEGGDPLRDIAAAQKKITEVDMFKGFLNNYREPPPSKP